MHRLVVFAPNWLGDAVMALPAIADVRQAAPDAFLTIAARPSLVPFFRMIPGADEVAALGGNRRSAYSGHRESWSPFSEAAIRSPRPVFDAAILLPNSFHAAWVAWQAAIPERWGYRGDWRGPLLTRAVDPVPGVHQVEYYQRLVRSLGFATVAPCPGVPRVPVPDELRETGIRELKGAGWDEARPLVAFAPGAAYGGAKRWSPASFAELARTLGDDGMQVVMVGSHADLPVARQIEASLDASPVLNLMGTDLPTMAGILSACRALVSNDSGAMHLAAAIGIRVTAVFGPTDERQTRPAGDGHIVLTNPVWCRPCMMRECPIDHRCMDGIGPERVAGAVRQML